ncbi:GreA/GreB family elongation factor [Polyangium mundeleinium]|uniref:GreA/GreB family elongation factor n=1 Tax=Polyangium mundeleinium TaxID=2995306 RepID=A0ABT5EJ95_9BACT|nr:GreA/GreB family elongation factor [Polyangium mundeleinium]MDC0741027.1 GreA/GreB family elongation factor [Polyangium mundeleinium]
MVQLDKQALLKELRTRLGDELATMARIASEAAAAASHEENKPENDKDMRSTEASYIARGQAERARELERSLALLGAIYVRAFAPGDGIAATALVTLVHRGAKLVCFVLPAAGGQRVKVGGTEVQVVTPTSPLGAALMGLSEGDEAEVPTPQGTKVYEVESVA